MVWHDGADLERMYNWYTQLYNETVFDVLRETRGFDSVPLPVRPGSVVAVGAVDGRPDYGYADGVTSRLYAAPARGCGSNGSYCGIR